MKKFKKNKCKYKFFSLHLSISNERIVLVYSSFKCLRFNYKVKDLKSILLEKKHDWNARRDTSEATVLERAEEYNHSADFTTRVLNLNRRTVSADSSLVRGGEPRANLLSHNFHGETKRSCRCVHGKRIASPRHFRKSSGLLNARCNIVTRTTRRKIRKQRYEGAKPTCISHRKCTTEFNG